MRTIMCFKAAAAVLVFAIVMPGRPVRAAASAWATEAHGAARLISAVEATGSGPQVDAALQLRLSPGWHTYWRSPGDAGIAPAIDWRGSSNLAGTVISWPAPRRLPPLAGLETIGYMDGVVLPISLTLKRPGAPLHLHAEVDYASCQDVCIPYHASLDLSLPAGLATPGPEAALIAAARARVPGDFAAAQLRLDGAAVEPGAGGGAMLAIRIASTGPRLRAPDLFVEGAPGGSIGRPVVTLSNGGTLATLRVPIAGAAAPTLAHHALHLTVIDGPRAAEIDATPLPGRLPPLPARASRLPIIGLALLGGLILNLMPCVLPVLSLKLLALVGLAGAERRAARRGLLATAAGIVASFGVLAAALIGLKQAGAAVGWGIQFQMPWFLTSMALLTALFAASLWDWLPLSLPGGVADAVGTVRPRSRIGEAFLLGAFTTLLAASCSAPFVGTALGFALARGPSDIALVFGAMGLGMAAPFLTVATIPRLASWLPRPGPWMVWLRRMLGLSLLATAVWLLSVFGGEAGSAAALSTGAALALLLVALAARHHLAGWRRVLGFAAAGAAAAALVPAFDAAAVPDPAPAHMADAAFWRPFDQAGLRRAVTDGKIVFVDVSAAWCLTCKVNELTVLDRPPVADRLHGAGVVAMRADWTRPDPVVAAYLQSFGRYGVPLDVVYGPGAPHGIALPELLTAGAVSDAFRRAGAGTSAGAGVRNP